MTLNVFTECGSKSGFGHIYRCLSLIEHFSIYKFKIHWHIKLDNDSDIIPDLIGEISTLDWTNFKFSSLLKTNIDLCIFDSYKVNLDEYIDKEKINHKAFIVSITDSKLNYYSKGVIIFPSLYSKNFVTKINSNRILYGPHYFLVSSIIQKYINHSTKKIYSNKIKTIGISLGGTNNEILVNIIIDQLTEHLGDSKIFLYSNNQNLSHKIEILGYLPKGEYIESILELDLLITGAGQSLNEAVLLGIPVIPIALNNSQINNRDYWLEELGMNCSIKTINDNLNNYLSNYLKCQEKMKVLDYKKREFLANGSIRVARELHNSYLKHIDLML